MLAHAAVHIQPLFSLPHGSQHVRAVEFFFKHRQRDGKRAVRGALPLCRSGSFKSFQISKTI